MTTVYQRRKLHTATILVLVAMLLGTIYVIFSDGFGSIYPFVAGIGSGFLIGIIFSLLELEVFTGNFRRLRFNYILLIRTLVYIVVVMVVVILITSASRSLSQGVSIGQIFTSPEYQAYLTTGDFPIAISYAAALILVINFALLINRKMGQGVLINYVLGTYYYPLKSERIFMFINLKNSRQVAHQSHSLVLLDFLNDFYYDITEPILAHKGTIYQYVDDQAVITWSMKRGTSEVNCLRAAFGCKQRIEELKEKYLAKYGLVPKFTVGIHCGPIIRGEVGEVKTDIAYHGDTMNTAARIADLGSRSDLEVLISAPLLYRLDMPSIYRIQGAGKVKLKGKDTEMELHQVLEVQMEDLPNV